MKYLVWLMSAVNLYLGVRCLLNAIGVLQTSKYAQSTTVIFTILFLGFGAAGFYFTIWRPDIKLALLLAFGPWLLGILVMFITMITSNHQ